MAEQILEFRGIPLSLLIDFCKELNASQHGQEFPVLMTADDWQIELLREETVRITSTFHVNAVFIRFTAHSEECLGRLLASFRKKTLRVGG